MSLVSSSTVPYIATDQILVDQIVHELKSQGIFDSFRKECIADVDTKPAYQNLRQRVEGSVGSFLKEQKWKPESNKNQLRDMLRKNIYESGFLETGVERIVNQVVNPKISTVFLPKVKEVFYKYIGLQTPAITNENSFNNIDSTSKVENESITQNLLPTDLDAIPPDNENANNEATEDSNSMAIDDDDTSPPFEPIDEDLSFKVIPIEENSIDSHLSGMSCLASHNSQHSNKENIVAMQQLLESDSQVSKNSSSDDRLSIVTDEASNTKVDILVVNDGVVSVIETTETSDNDDGKNDKNTNVQLYNEISQEIKDKDDDEDKDDDKDKVTIIESNNKSLVDSKIKEEINNLEIKDEIIEEDSKIILSSEMLDCASKVGAVDSTSKHNSPHKKDVTKEHKKESSRHHSSSKSRDKSKDTKDYRESKTKSSKSKSSSSSKDKDKVSKSKSNSSSSNRHSSDKDREHSSSRRHSSSSSKDKNSTGSTKDKSSSSKDKSKDKDNTTSGSKDKDSSISSKLKESSKDHSSSKSSTSSSKDKSSSKDNKDSKSKQASSAEKSYKSEHRSSSSRKYSSSSISREDSSKSHSSTTKDKRDKKENSTKDDHFSSKTQRTDRRSTDRDSNDGQTKTKGGSTSDGTALLLKNDEQRSTNNTPEDSSSSNSKDGSNSDCCQTGSATKIIPEEIKIKDKHDEIFDNMQPVVVISTMTDLKSYTDSKLVDSLEDSEGKNIPTPPIIETIVSKVLKSAIPDFGETLDAIKSHLAAYKLDEQAGIILPKIKLPKFASNFREARKIMKLRKQLRQQNKLRKLLIKEYSTDSETIDRVNVEESTNRENCDDSNAVVRLESVEKKDKKTADDNTSDNSLIVLEKDITNDDTAINTTQTQMETVQTNKEYIEANNDDCFYLDKISEKTTRYLNYTSRFIEKLNKEITAPQVKGINDKQKGKKRKISTLSSDSSINNDTDQSNVNISNAKVSTKTRLNSSTSDSIGASKGDVHALSSGGDNTSVTSATAHVHVVKQRRINNSKATQRYTSDDLYKPRPFLKGTTKRTSGRVAN